MEDQTDAPVATGGPTKVVKPGGVPDTVSAGTWLGTLSTPAANWQVQKIHSTFPVAASRQ